MKKLSILVAISVLATSFVFGQSAEFTKHMTKAKEYEAQKKYAYALGEYYDALDADDEFEIKNEAFKAYKNLASIIENGKPGYGEFDEFSKVDNWILLLQNFEQYWTEYCPVIIICGTPERISLNREAKTATYDVKISWKKNPKYEEISKVLKAGLEKAYNSDWQMPFLEEWPEVSVYNTIKDKDKFLQNGVALTQCLLRYGNFRGLGNIGDYVYTAYKVLASTAKFGCIERNCFGVHDAYDPTTLYDLKLKFIDDTGKEIFTGKRVLLGPIAKYTFTVDQEQMKKLEDGEYSITLDAIYLQYGNIPLEPWITKDSRDWIKTLKEIEISPEKVTIMRDEDIQKKSAVEEFSKQSEANELALKAQERKQEQERSRKGKKERLRQLRLSELNSRLSNYYQDFMRFGEASYKENFLRTVTHNGYGGSEYDIHIYMRLYPECFNNYDREKVYKVIRYIRCNTFSSLSNLTPVYSISGHNSFLNYVDELNFYLENFNQIKTDMNASGYRLLDEKEAESLQGKVIQLNTQGVKVPFAIVDTNTVMLRKK